MGVLTYVGGDVACGVATKSGLDQTKSKLA